MSHEVTLTDDQTQDSHSHSTTIEITGNGQVNAAFEDTETNCRNSRTPDVPNGGSQQTIPTGQEETPSTPRIGAGNHHELNHHNMNGGSAHNNHHNTNAENSNNKINGVGGDAKTPTSNDVKDVAEAVNLELVNMQPFNNGIPVKKESTELDIGDPYDEYFVPVNQHKKYMRGEKLYVTQDKRRSLGGGKRKCCWGLLSVIVLGIIVAILIGVLLSQDSNSPVESRNFNSNVKGAGLAGSLSTPPPKSTQQPPRTTTTDVSDKYLPRVIEGELTIDNMEFTPDLANQNSSEFITLATSLEEELKRALFDRQMLLYGSSDITVKVLEFKSGSVVVTYRVGWEFKPGIHGSPDPLTKETMKTRLQEHLRNNDGFLYNYRMPISSLKSSNILDNCEIDKNNCSHICTFNITVLQFRCSCPAEYILDSDGKTCIENYVKDPEDNQHHHDDAEEPMMPPPQSPDYDQEHQDDHHHSSSETYPSEEHNIPEHETAHQIPTSTSTEQHQMSEGEEEEQNYPNIHSEYEPSSSTEYQPEHHQELPEFETAHHIPVTSTERQEEHQLNEHDMYQDWNDGRDQWHETDPLDVVPQEPPSPSPEPVPELHTVQETIPEMKSSTETNMPELPPNTELIPVSEEVSPKLVPAVESIPEIIESSTDKGMVSESDINNLSSEMEHEVHPDMITETVSHETTNAPDVSHDVVHVNHTEEVSEELKPLSELMSPVEVHRAEDETMDEAVSKTEEETQVISGNVPVTSHPKLNAEDSNVAEQNETQTQTEHVAGSMRSLNLGLIVPLNENQPMNSVEILNTTQPMFTAVEPEMVITTEMPSHYFDPSNASEVTSLQPESVDVSPSMEYSPGQNSTMENKVSTENMRSEVETGSTEHAQMSRDMFHSEEIDNTHDSMIITEPKTTLMPETMAPETMSSSSSTENLPVMMFSPEQKFTTAPVENTDQEMTKELEFGITHPVEEMNITNDTMSMNPAVTENLSNTEPATTVLPGVLHLGTADLGATVIPEDHESMKHEELITTPIMVHQPVDESKMENATESGSKTVETSEENNGRSIGISVEPETTDQYHPARETVSPEQTIGVTTTLPEIHEEPKVEVMSVTEHESNMKTMADNVAENAAITNPVESTTHHTKAETVVPSIGITTFVPEEVLEEMKPTVIPEIGLHQQSMENATEHAEEKQTEVTEPPMLTVVMDHETMSGKLEDGTEEKPVITTMIVPIEENENVTETVLGEVHFGSISEENATKTDENTLQSSSSMAPTVGEVEEVTTIHNVVDEGNKNITEEVVSENVHMEQASSSTEKDMNTLAENSTLVSAETMKDVTDAEKVNAETVTEQIAAMTTVPAVVKAETMAPNLEIVTEAESSSAPNTTTPSTSTTEAAQPPSPLPHPSIEHMIPLTHIPDLAGPFSVDTIIEHPSSYLEDDKSDEPSIIAVAQPPPEGQIVHPEEHHTDLTADTLNSLDDDYTEEDKKKYYKPSKTKNLKNFKIQEVNVPIDSLADETSKDVQHSKEQPTTKEVVITTMEPSVVRENEELISNDAYTTKSPLFKEEKPIKNNIDPAQVLSKQKDERLNNLFFSNDAETTISPIFDNTLNNTANNNKTHELINSDLFQNNTQTPAVFVDHLNQLEAKVDTYSGSRAETVTENIPPPSHSNEEFSMNSTSTVKMNDDAADTSSIQTQPQIIPNSNMKTDEIEVTSMKTETTSMKTNEMESKQFNTSAVLLTPSKKCASGQFACADGSACIKTIQQCDAVRDCDDGSDEMNCEEQGCLGNFQCKNRQCLKRSLVCDSMPNCSDGSDESDCDNWKCNFDEVRCHSSRQCIPALWKCDGKDDCSDNSDEWNCRDSCANDEFLCPEGRCIPHNKTCNGVNDCLKGEDELQCNPV